MDSVAFDLALNNPEDFRESTLNNPEDFQESRQVMVDEGNEEEKEEVRKVEDKEEETQVVEEEDNDGDGGRETPSFDHHLHFDPFFSVNVPPKSQPRSSGRTVATNESRREVCDKTVRLRNDHVEGYANFESALETPVTLNSSERPPASVDGGEPVDDAQRHRQDSSSSGDGEPGYLFSGTDVDRPQLCSEPSMDNAASINDVNRRVVGVIGRDVDQPRDVVDQLVNNVDLESEDWRDIFFRPVVIPHGALARSDCSEYLTGANFHFIMLCYNTTQARIMLTSSHGGYYRQLLPFAKRYLGENNVLFVLTHCQTQSTDLVNSAMELRLRGQPLMEDFFDRHQVFSWDERASPHQQKRFLEIVKAHQRQKEQCSIL